MVTIGDLHCILQTDRCVCSFFGKLCNFQIGSRREGLITQVVEIEIVCLVIFHRPGNLDLHRRVIAAKCKPQIANATS